MKIKQGKNKLLIPLTIITIVIWGIIIYNIVGYYNSFDDNSSEVIGSPDDLEVMDAQTQLYNKFQVGDYIELERDPFVFGKKKRNDASQQSNSVSIKTKKEKASQESKPNSSINYTITGTLINNVSRLAILEDLTNKKTIFMREGEGYLSIVIKEIFPAKVVIIENGSEKEISIKN